MNEDQFSVMLAIIVPPIIEQITKNSNIDDDKAISGFYQSKLYHELRMKIQVVALQSNDFIHDVSR